MSRSSTSKVERAALVDALDGAMRRMSSQGVLLSHAIAERLGMHSTDLESLGFLHEEGPVPAGRLADLTGLTTGAVTRMIDRLERAGYVRREPDSRDRRRVIVRALPERAVEIAPHFADVHRAMAELYERYSDEELATILDFATRADATSRELVAKLRAIGSSSARTPDDPAP